MVEQDLHDLRLPQGDCGQPQVRSVLPQLRGAVALQRARELVRAASRGERRQQQRQHDGLGDALRQGRQGEAGGEEEGQAGGGAGGAGGGGGGEGGEQRGEGGGEGLEGDVELQGLQGAGEQRGEEVGPVGTAEEEALEVGEGVDV